MSLPHLSVTEFREPLFQFSMPSRISVFLEGNEANDGSASVYGFFLPSIPYWLELVAMVLLNTILAAMTGWCIFKLIVEPRKFYDSPNSKILGYGVILPFWICWPVIMSRLLVIRNLFFRFVACLTPTLCLFRTTEAMYGCSPPFATKSAKDFTIYYGSFFLFTRDKNGNLVKHPKGTNTKHFLNFVVLLCTLGALQSVATSHKHFAVFGSLGDDDDWFSFHRLGTWQLYANSCFHAVILQMMLTTYAEGLMFLFSVLTGSRLEPVMKNPIFTSKSIADFWGRKWNLVVHAALKGGVFKPVRKHYSTTVAAMATFLASGLFHEWLLYAVFTPLPQETDENGECPSCHSPTYGGAIVFFLWAAIMALMEVTVGNTTLVEKLPNNIPDLLRTAIVLLLLSPFAHFFHDSYFRSNIFRHGQIGLPMIIRIN